MTNTTTQNDPRYNVNLYRNVLQEFYENDELDTDDRHNREHFASLGKYPTRAEFKRYVGNFFNLTQQIVEQDLTEFDAWESRNPDTLVGEQTIRMRIGQN